LQSLIEPGVTLSALVRNGQRRPSPDPQTRLAAGDVLVLYGPQDALEKMERRLL